MASMANVVRLPVAHDGDYSIPGVSSAVFLHAATTLSLVAACAHLWAAPAHFLMWWGHGLLFLSAAMAHGLFAVILLRWRTNAVYNLGILLNLSLVSVYIAIRTATVPPLSVHAAHGFGILDIVCVSVELSLVAILVFLSGSKRSASLCLALAAVLAFGSGLALHAVRGGVPGSAFGWIEVSVLSVPAAVLCLALSTPVSRRAARYFYGSGEDGFFPRLLWMIFASSLFAAASIPTNGLDGAGVVLVSSFALLFAVASIRGLPWDETKGIDFNRPRALTALAGTVAAVAVLAFPAIFGGVFAPPAEAQSVPGACDEASYDHSYDVAAVNVRVPYNRWGGLDPHGQAFVLQGDKAAVKNWSEPLAANPANDPAGNRRLRPRPLVIRANAGDCVRVDFRNELNAQGEDGLPNNPRASMKVFGPSYDAQTSDGSAVGYNDDTTVAIGESISYFWKVPEQEGIYLFRDQGAMSGSEANSGSLGHGLYGALAVEPEGSAWLDPTTGEPIYDGTRDHRRVTKSSGDPYIDADIAPPNSPAFRETVQISQDELPGGQGFGFNYGAEPGFNRIATNPAGEGNAEDLAPDAIGEETSLSSWTYGDPALIKLASGEGPWLPVPNPDKPGTRFSPEDCGLEDEPGGSCYVSNVVHSYPGDPTKIRYAHAGVKETHVFHMHAHQWLAEPGDVGDSGAPSGEISDANRPDSTTIDSQTYGPGETFTAELLYGAGSKPGTIGDSIFHCHLYPHFADGFWALFRVHDVIEDGTMSTPDGVNVRTLMELPDRVSSAPGATAANPGYPRFMPGEFGWRAPQPPGGISESNGSPDDPDTTLREDLDPGVRVTAGRHLDPATLDPDDDPATDPLSARLADKLELEASAQNLHYTGDPNTPANAEPGAPFTDPCPSGSREVTYNVSVIQADVTYNEAGWHDKQGRILVLDEDVDDILAGENPEPLFIRVNAGDCVNFNLTNRLPNFFGNDEFVQLAQTNMIGEHIHLVKFDVMGSDGSSNGWNYQQAAFTREQAEFNENAVNGRVQNCDWNECRLQTPDPETFDPEAAAAEAGANPGQTIHERWFADYELRTVFTHDHHFPALDQNRGLFGAMIVEPNGTDFRNPRTGEFYQPINDSSHTNASDSIPTNDEVCAGADNSCNANAAGTAMDVIGAGNNDDFREFGLAVQDFVSLHRSDADGGEAIQAPALPEEFPDADPGVMGVNYRNAPFVLRNTKNGRPTDPAHVFSSTVHGDPDTPVFQAYSEDPVRMRVVQGSQEEQHVMTVHGVRWPQEPDDPESPLVNTQAVGISEAFNFQIPRFTCGTNDTSCAGDYLYSATATDDMYLGIWGLIRARGRQIPSLLPLPDNANPNEPTNASAPTASPPQPGGGSATGLAPPEANAPGTPCPTNAPIRKYNVVAMDANIEYNRHGDHDPFGLIYALASDEAEIRAGEKQPEPLTIRANEGECIEVRLTNKVSQSWLNAHPNAGTDGDPTLPLEPPEGTPAGMRVSLHPQLVRYDVRGSDGTAVGYNRDQSVASGDTRLYRWFADNAGQGEIGATNLLDFGDVRGHRHHGLFAALNIEPSGSTHHDPQTGDEIQAGAAADIRIPGANNDFREFSLFYQDGLNLRDESGAPIEDPLDHPPTPEEPEGEGLDPEDQGEKGFNYGNATFDHRTGNIPDTGLDGRTMSDVFSSTATSPITGEAHGDPDTPIFRAFAGDPVRMRVLQGADKPRQHTFQVSGHSWRAQPGDPGSTIIGTQGGMSVGRSFSSEFDASGFPGDYRYGSGVGFHHISGGLWGIMRLYPQLPLAQAISPTPISAVDDPRAGGHPILPLETPASTTAVSFSADPATVDAGNSTTLSGNLTVPNVGGLTGKRVVIEQRPDGASAWEAVPEGTLTTGGGGSFTLENVSPTRTTEYRATFAGQPGVGLGSSTSQPTRVEVRGGVTVGLASGAPTIVYGEDATLSGSLASDGSPLSGERVVIEHKPHGATDFTPAPGQPANGVVTDSGGDFELSGIRPEKNTEYRAVFAGGAGLAASESEAVEIGVKVLVSVKASPASVKAGRSIVISGDVKPAHTGNVRVTIRGGPRLVVRNDAISSGSRFSLRYKPPKAGRYTVSVRFAGDADHLPNTSPTRGFRAAK